MIFIIILLTAEQLWIFCIRNIFMFYHAIIFSMIIISCDYKHRYRHRNTDIDDWIWFCKSQFIEMWFDMHENILMLFLTVSQLHLIIFKLGVRLFSMHKMISWFTVTWLLQLWSICQSMFSRILLWYTISSYLNMLILINNPKLWFQRLYLILKHFWNCLLVT